MAILNLTTGMVFLKGVSGTYAVTTLTTAAGVVGAPAIAYASDTDTGIYWAANTLNISTGGTRRVSVDNSGTTLTSGSLFVFTDAGTIQMGAASDCLISRLAAGSIAMTNSALAATSTDGLTLINATAATGGATVQMSPRLRLRGSAWDTAATKTLDWIIENLPATAATPTSTLKFGHSLNGAAYTYPMTLGSSGILTILSTISAANYVMGGSGGSFYWPSSTVIGPPGANGYLAITNFATTAGISLDVTVDQVILFRDRARTAGAAFGSLPLPVTVASGGTAIASTSSVVELTTDGNSDEDNGILANGTAPGQMIFIGIKAVGNAADSVKITPTTFLGGTKISFAANPIGKGCTMMWTASGWVCCGTNGGVVS